RSSPGRLVQQLGINPGVQPLCLAATAFPARPPRTMDLPGNVAAQLPARCRSAAASCSLTRPGRHRPPAVRYIIGSPVDGACDQVAEQLPPLAVKASHLNLLDRG